MLNQKTIQKWTQKERDKLLTFVNEKHDIENAKVYAVGSRVMKTHSEDSDIDIVLFSEERNRDIYVGEYEGVRIMIYNKNLKEGMSCGWYNIPYVDLSTGEVFDDNASEIEKFYREIKGKSVTINEG